MVITFLSCCNKNGYDYNKTVAFILVFAIVITNTSIVLLKMLKYITYI